MIRRHIKAVTAALAAVLALLSIWQLEQARAGIDRDAVRLDGTPATIYRAPGSGGQLVLVSHGFAGSRQMMEAISLTLARAGHVVVAFDYPGHGRHPGRLSPDITRLTGTTADLVRQTRAIAEAARARTGIAPVALVGHSMATDVIVRAAADLDGVTGVAAISMYSDRLSPTHPQRLLVVSGARETRLREVARTAVAQVEPVAPGDVARDGAVERRAVVAPRVGHVGVLWSPATLRAVADWFGPVPDLARTGPWIAVLLAAILALAWPLTAMLPRGARDGAPAPLRRAAMAAALPAPVAALAAMSALPVGGSAGFGGLALGLFLWGTGALAILRPRLRLGWPDVAAAGFVILWGLGVFGLALDRYGAAFVPAGPRLPLMVALLPATLVVGLADRALVEGRGIPARLLLRLPLLLALGAAMALRPTSVGLLFTILPVLVLFVLVHGSIARWAGMRGRRDGAALGQGVALAWAIAASTPLFATA
ncbi:Alpha/beta hydrolase family protein [Roseivivax jejudonensis]|uniref:Alpha/beta hydrolase family protein n=1 Tax=Roseivivax jejudonensis TaxID=1529041 RepID=A0A1X6YN61_9RHOB|nr:alpha/beta fold hydrolase [Roseivivax jejudonensis]SLN26354.1 Alpha/beta hydrolase family protein [Roseivivax jejudonensis]